MLNRIEQQLGFILKSQSYKETSVIHQVFTKDYGLVSILSKGSRVKNSKQGSLLQAFRCLQVSWVGKSELKTLTGVEESQHRTLPLKGRSLYCGFYANELILNFLQKHDEHQQLFNAYEELLDQLSGLADIEPPLRQFEKTLLEDIGYGLQLQYEANTGECIKPEEFYTYQHGHGALLAKKPHKEKLFLGDMLINLHDNQLKDKAQIKQAKRLMRTVIDSQLGGKILKSRELFK